MEYMATELATHHFSLVSPYYPSGYFLCPLMISALGSFSSTVIILGDLSINSDDSPNTLVPKSLDYLSPSNTSLAPSSSPGHTLDLGTMNIYTISKISDSKIPLPASPPAHSLWSFQSTGSPT